MPDSPPFFSFSSLPACNSPACSCAFRSSRFPPFVIALVPAESPVQPCWPVAVSKIVKELTTLWCTLRHTGQLILLSGRRFLSNKMEDEETG